jgi:hypothetical protein
VRYRLTGSYRPFRRPADGHADDRGCRYGLHLHRNRKALNRRDGGSRQGLGHRVTTLLEAIQEGINTSLGGSFTGTETANEWNSQLAHLLSACPYEEEMTKRVKKAFEEGGTVTVERSVDKKNKTLKVVCQTPKGKTGQTATWSDGNEPQLTVEKALFEGQILDRDAQARALHVELRPAVCASFSDLVPDVRPHASSRRLRCRACSRTGTSFK